MVLLPSAEGATMVESQESAKHEEVNCSAYGMLETISIAPILAMNKNSTIIRLPS